MDFNKIPCCIIFIQRLSKMKSPFSPYLTFVDLENQIPCRIYPPPPIPPGKGRSYIISSSAQVISTALNPNYYPKTLTCMIHLLAYICRLLSLRCQDNSCVNTNWALSVYFSFTRSRRNTQFKNVYGFIYEFYFLVYIFILSFKIDLNIEQNNVCSK